MVEVYQIENKGEVISYVINEQCYNCKNINPRGKVIAFWTSIESRADFYCDNCLDKAIRIGNYQELRVVNSHIKAPGSTKRVFHYQDPVFGKMKGGVNVIPEGGKLNDHTRVSKDSQRNIDNDPRAEKGLELQRQGLLANEAHRKKQEFNIVDDFDKPLNGGEINLFLDYQKNISVVAVDYYENERKRIEQKEKSKFIE